MAHSDAADGKGEKLAIHAHVHAGTRERFEAYVDAVGATSASAVLTLLILREIETRQLGSMTSRATVVDTDAARSTKVSAYMLAPHATRFRDWTAQLGRSLSDCAAELVEREIGERWLQDAIARLPEEAA